jgi:hypothetical protein
MELLEMVLIFLRFLQYMKQILCEAEQIQHFASSILVRLLSPIYLSGLVVRRFRMHFGVDFWERFLSLTYHFDVDQTECSETSYFNPHVIFFFVISLFTYQECFHKLYRTHLPASRA